MMAQKSVVFFMFLISLLKFELTGSSSKTI
jgi:hypothetical protein